MQNSINFSSVNYISEYFIYHSKALEWNLLLLFSTLITKSKKRSLNVESF